MKLPKLLHHVFNSESKSVSFGWVLSMASTALYVAGMPGFSAERWERMIVVAALLIGGKVVKETILEGLDKKKA